MRRIVFFVFAIAATFVWQATAVAQRTDIKGGLRVFWNDTNNPYIHIEASDTKGAELYLDGPETDGQITILNGDPLTPYDVFIHSEDATEDRWLKLTNKAPGDSGDSYAFGIMIDGSIELLPINQNQIPRAGFYSLKDGQDEFYVYVRDTTGNDTILSSHQPPENKVPNAMNTSFADPSYDLPFSLSHQNRLIGKGQVIDMAKLVRFVEAQMIEEFGSEEGRIVHNYDLPESERISLAKYRDQRRKFYLENMDAQMRWEKIPLGPDRKLPEEAFAMVDEVEPTQREVTVTEDVVDFETEKVVTMQRTKKIVESARTGRQVKTLKPNYKLIKGELYRAPEYDNVDAKLADEASFDPPQWVIDRIQKD
jgi:hypothetical protein